MKNRILATGMTLALSLGLLASGPAAAEEGATVRLYQHARLGTILTDAEGMTLYTFANDQPGVSNCYDACARNWPPLLLEGESPVAPEGMPGELGTTTRTDGTVQVTYNGMPLYRWVNDGKPGDVTGHLFRDIWFAAKVEPATVQVAEHPSFGRILTDAAGMTLYVFTRDQVGVSNCYGQCEAAWPPLLIDAGTPIAPEGLAGMLGTTVRTDGSVQVTFNGMPLYYWVSDLQPGDTYGHQVNDVWFVARPGQMPDVAGHWSEAQVAAAVRGGWVNGYPDGLFRPEGKVTRAEFVKMLAGAFVLEESASSGTFPDTESHWAAGIIEAALDAGILKPADYAGGRFEPDRAILREEVAVLAIRALGLEGEAALRVNASLPFADDGSVSAGARGHLALAVEKGILTGYPDQTVRAGETVTRAEAVVMVQRALQAR